MINITIFKCLIICILSGGSLYWISEKLDFYVKDSKVEIALIYLLALVVTFGISIFGIYSIGVAF